MAWQPHVGNSSNPQSCLPVLFWAILNLPFSSVSFPLYVPLSSLFPPSPLLSLCFALPHSSLSRTTGACLLSSQCFYSLALAQGSIHSGHCIHSAFPIIHMLTWERAAFASAHEMTTIEHRWAFDSPADHFTLLIKATLSLTNKSFIHFKCHI